MEESFSFQMKITGSYSKIMKMLNEMMDKMKNDITNQKTKIKVRIDITQVK